MYALWGCRCQLLSFFFNPFKSQKVIRSQEKYIGETVEIKQIKNNMILLQLMQIKKCVN